MGRDEMEGRRMGRDGGRKGRMGGRQNSTSSFFNRYKVTCRETWPSYHGSTREAAEVLCQHHNLTQEVAYGNTKLFIRNPQTLTSLEQERVKQLPYVAVTIQRVSKVIHTHVHECRVSWVRVPPEAAHFS